MRTQDNRKKEALFEATVKLVNDIGFSSTSVSKIAKEANVSSSTLYVYHKNKEELLVHVYHEIKKLSRAAMLKDFDEENSIRDILKKVWFNVYRFANEHNNYFQYAEQFVSTPYIDLVDENFMEYYYAEVFQTLQRGIQQNIIKDIDCYILLTFLFVPITVFSNRRLSGIFTVTEEDIEKSFQMAWDAIKL